MVSMPHEDGLQREHSDWFGRLFAAVKKATSGGSLHLFVVDVEGGGRFVYDAIDVQRFRREMFVRHDERPYTVRPYTWWDRIGSHLPPGGVTVYLGPGYVYHLSTEDGFQRTRASHRTWRIGFVAALRRRV